MISHVVESEFGHNPKLDVCVYAKYNQSKIYVILPIQSEVT